MYNNSMTTRGKQFSPTDLAYIAGFVDGEGTVAVYRKYDNREGKRWNSQYFERVIIVQVDPAPLLFIKEFFPTACLSLKKRINPTHRDIYALKYTHRNAYELAKAIYPYLRVKKERARLLIEFRENMVYVDRTQKFFGGKRLPEEEVKRRAELFQKIRDLNSLHGRPNVQPQRLSEKASLVDDAIVRSA